MLPQASDDAGHIVRDSGTSRPAAGPDGWNGPKPLIFPGRGVPSRAEDYKKTCRLTLKDVGPDAVVNDFVLLC